MDKAGSLFLRAKCLKNTDDLHLYLKCDACTGFFKHFTSKNQLPGFYISETLVENGLRLCKAYIPLVGFTKFAKHHKFIFIH